MEKIVNPMICKMIKRCPIADLNASIEGKKKATKLSCSHMIPHTKENACSMHLPCGTLLKAIGAYDLNDGGCIPYIEEKKEMQTPMATPV